MSLIYTKSWFVWLCVLGVCSSIVVSENIFCSWSRWKCKKISIKEAINRDLVDETETDILKRYKRCIGYRRRSCCSGNCTGLGPSKEELTKKVSNTLGISCVTKFTNFGLSSCDTYATYDIQKHPNPLWCEWGRWSRWDYVCKDDILKWKVSKDDKLKIDNILSMNSTGKLFHGLVTQSRQRVCGCPGPRKSSEKCSGVSREGNYKSMTEMNLDYCKWCQWSEWGKCPCSSYSYSSQQYRYRSCICPDGSLKFSKRSSSFVVDYENKCKFSVTGSVSYLNYDMKTCYPSKCSNSNSNSGGYDNDNSGDSKKSKTVSPAVYILIIVCVVVGFVLAIMKALKKSSRRDASSNNTNNYNQSSQYPQPTPAVTYSTNQSIRIAHPSPSYQNVPASEPVPTANWPRTPSTKPSAPSATSEMPPPPSYEECVKGDYNMK